MLSSVKRFSRNPNIENLIINSLYKPIKKKKTYTKDKLVSFPNHCQSRKMCTEIDLHGKKLIDLGLEEFYINVAKKVFENGVILIRNQEKLSEEEYIECCYRFGKILKLPKELGFNNLHRNFHEIVRVGNINNQDQIMKQYSAAEYFHTDGNFWPEGENYILNFLFSKICPEIGGDTVFFDMQELFESFNKDEQNKFEKSYFEFDIEAIPDFKGLKAESLNMERFVKHPLIYKNPFTDKKALYIGSDLSIIYYSDGSIGSGKEFIKEYIESLKHKWIFHKWKKGDILIWDNTQVMHRGMGGYFDNPRLLYRCQTRITDFYLDMLNKLMK